MSTRQSKVARLLAGRGLAQDPPVSTGLFKKAADGNKNTLTLSVPSGSKGEPEEDKTFSVAKSVRIMVDAGKKEKGAAYGLRELDADP